MLVSTLETIFCYLLVEMIKYPSELDDHVNNMKKYIINKILQNIKQIHELIIIIYLQDTTAILKPIYISIFHQNRCDVF